MLINIVMKELFIPFYIPNLEEIQIELKNSITHDYKGIDKPHAFNHTHLHMIQFCPTFMDWFLPKCKAVVRLYRFYITPPRQQLGAHIDGGTISVPFGINIPVYGCKNTYHSYYETTDDNLITDPGHNGYQSGRLVKDQYKCKLISEVEIVRPYVTNNEILHGVRNDTDDYRIMFTVRWALHPTKFRSIEEVMVVDELKLGQP